MITIKDFQGVDSKRTSLQSEFSNEEQFRKLLEDSQNRNAMKEDKVIDHLEEPLIQATSVELKNDPSDESIQSSKDNIKISEILKQKQDIHQIINQSHKSQEKDQSTRDQTGFDDPAFITQNLSDEPSLKSSNNDGPPPPLPSDNNLIAAKVKQIPPTDEKLSPEQIQIVLKDDSEKQKLLEKITNDVMRDLIYDCVAVPERKKTEETSKDAQ